LSDKDLARSGWVRILAISQYCCIAIWKVKKFGTGIAQCFPKQENAEQEKSV
jgi:hypothetical protein